MLVAGFILLIFFWRLVLAPAGRRARRKEEAATILRIDSSWMFSKVDHHHTYVTFETNKRRVRLHLTPKQAFEFFDNHYAVGDTGILTYSGEHMYSWLPHSAANPMKVARDVSAFISYSHRWGQDAAYVARFLQGKGLRVWFDNDQLRTGQSLTREIRQAIEQSNYFVPLMNNEYWTSEWCVREFETAISLKKSIIPLVVSNEPMVMPPHIRNLYNKQLGEPLFLDLRGQNPIKGLTAIADMMTG